MVGVKPNFSNIDILRCFFLIGEKEVISRQSLCFNLELGEGTIRSILQILKKRSLLRSTRKGHSLSEKGTKIFDVLKEYINLPRKVETPFYPGKKQVAIKLKTQKDLPISVEHRDMAIKAGADAALILKFKNSLYAEGIGFDDFDSLETLFDFSVNNILIISFADTLRDAANGALAVALTLDSRLSKEITQLEMQENLSQ